MTSIEFSFTINSKLRHQSIRINGKQLLERRNLYAILCNTLPIDIFQISKLNLWCERLNSASMLKGFQCLSCTLRVEIGNLKKVIIVIAKGNSMTKLNELLGRMVNL